MQMDGVVVEVQWWCYSYNNDGIGQSKIGTKLIKVVDKGVGKNVSGQHCCSLEIVGFF